VGVGPLNKFVVAMLSIDLHHRSVSEVMQVKSVLAVGAFCSEIARQVRTRMKHG